MSLPYIFSSSFDVGSNGEWDSETDSGTLLDFPHYRDLAALPDYPAPYRGAYCMRIQPGDTNDHTLKEGDLNISASSTAWVRFALFISSNFAATGNDTFNIFEWQKGDNTVEACISLKIVASTDLVQIAIADGTEASSNFVDLSKGVWHVIEAKAYIHTSSSGTLDLYVDGIKVKALTGLTQSAAITHGFLGTQNTASTTDTGYLLFDEFVFDDTRCGITHRWNTNRLITTSSFLFVGGGRVDNIKLIDGGGGDMTCELYDTDIYSASLTPVWRGRTVVANTDVDAADVPVTFSRGCLAVLTGTLPAAQFTLGRATGWGSDGAVRGVADRLPIRLGL